MPVWCIAAPHTYEAPLKSPATPHPFAESYSGRRTCSVRLPRWGLRWFRQDGTNGPRAVVPPCSVRTRTGASAPRPLLTYLMSAPVPPGSAPAAPVRPQAVGPVLVPPTAVPDRQGAVTFMSNNSRSGDWVLPRLFRALTIMGETKLDLTQVRLGAGTSEIQVRVFMGNIKIVVPHNLRVECDCTPALGEFKVKHQSNSMPSPDAPLIRITGGAFMGSVVVRVVDPNAPGTLAKMRAWVAGT